MDDKPTVIDVFQFAQRLNDTELHQLLTYLRDDLKRRYKQAARRAAAELRDAYWVETTKSGKHLPAGAKGHIVDVRREHVDVHFLKHGMFTVSATMLRQAEAPPGECAKPPEAH